MITLHVMQFIPSSVNQNENRQYWQLLIWKGKETGKKLPRRPAWHLMGSSFCHTGSLQGESTKGPSGSSYCLSTPVIKERQMSITLFHNPWDGACSSNENQIPSNGHHFNNSITFLNWPKHHHWEYFSRQTVLLNGKGWEFWEVPTAEFLLPIFPDVCHLQNARKQ